MKHIDELNTLRSGHGRWWGECEEVRQLREVIKRFDIAYKKYTGKPLNQKYYVCNQDEPYAKKVIDIILNGEQQKHSKNKT